MLYRRATVENRALEVCFSKRTGTSSLVTNPMSTPHRTQTWVFGPLPWMKYSRGYVLPQCLQIGIALPRYSPTLRDSSTIRLTGKKFSNELLTVARSNRFGMELNTMNVQGWMAQSHDEPRTRLHGIHNKGMFPVFNGDQRVVAGEFQVRCLG